MKLIAWISGGCLVGCLGMMFTMVVITIAVVVVIVSVVHAASNVHFPKLPALPSIHFPDIHIPTMSEFLPHPLRNLHDRRHPKVPVTPVAPSGPVGPDAPLPPDPRPFHPLQKKTKTCPLCKYENNWRETECRKCGTQLGGM